MVKILIVLILAPVLLKIVVLLIKRGLLHRKIVKACKTLNVTVKKSAPWFKSVFMVRGSTDYVIDDKIKVSVLTLPYRNARFHFVPDKRLVEVYISLFQSFLIGRTTYKPVATIRNTFKFAQFNVCLDAEDGFKHIMLVYPVAREVTCVKGNCVEQLYNGDEIKGGIVFNTSSFFFEHLEQYLSDSAE